MGWSLKRSFKILPGVRVNLSKSGLGISAGPKGFKVGVDPRGKSYTHVSIPKTGIYSRSYFGGKPATKREIASQDNLLEAATSVVSEYRRASPLLLQRRLSIGYAQATALLDELEARGIVGPQNGSRPREVLKN